MNPAPTEIPIPTPSENPPSSSPPSSSFKKPFLITGIILIFLISLGGAYFLGQKSSSTPRETPQPTVPQGKSCTLEAKICPDGTAVGRSGPNCEFSPCPATKNSPTPDPTTNWKTYTTQSENISVKYPPEWVYKEKSPSYIIFKTLSSTIPAGGESQLDGVQLSILRSTYDEAVQRGINTYGNKENLSVGNLIGQHIWGTITSGPASGISGGIYILRNIDGKAFEFEYETVNGKNYETEARLMMETSSLGK